MRKSGAWRMRRQNALDEMVTLAEQADEFTTPWRRCSRIWDNYTSETEILLDLHRLWRTELAGAIFIAIESGDGDLATDVARAYHQVLCRRYGVKKILDAYADHPAIAGALTKERSLLAAAAAGVELNLPTAA